MTYTKADFADALQQCRQALRSGNKSPVDLQKIIGCLLLAGGSSGMSLAADTLADATLTLKGVIDAQFAILNAFTGADAAADIVAAIATANAAISAEEAVVESLRVAEEAANPGAPLNLPGTVDSL